MESRSGHQKWNGGGNGRETSDSLYLKIIEVEKVSERERDRMRAIFVKF